MYFRYTHRTFVSEDSNRRKKLPNIVHFSHPERIELIRQVISFSFVKMKHNFLTVYKHFIKLYTLHFVKQNNFPNQPNSFSSEQTAWTRIRKEKLTGQGLGRINARERQTQTRIRRLENVQSRNRTVTIVSRDKRNGSAIRLYSYDIEEPQKVQMLSGRSSWLCTIRGANVYSRVFGDSKYD